MRASRHLLTASLIGAVLVIPHVRADERRAPAPKVNPDAMRNVFFSNLSDAFRGEIPSLSELRNSASAAAAPSPGGSDEAIDPAAAGNDRWSALISPTSLEDEIKRVKLHFDSVVTTPGAFNSGGYLEARLDLTILASLFAIIHQYPAEIRWKEQAATARDLIARTAFNCKAGSTQVYNEAKSRKGDLQDLIAGSELPNREAEEDTDWTMIADRAPLMEYADSLIESLEDGVRNEGTIKKEADLVKRNSELLAALGEILVQEGMDDADDGDYATLSRNMTTDAKAATKALERNDYEAVRLGVGKIRQKCDACHEQYR